MYIIYEVSSTKFGSSPAIKLEQIPIHQFAFPYYEEIQKLFHFVR